jgi:hypothetical protein
MVVGGISQDFMSYIATIEQASFGMRSNPLGVDNVTVDQMAKSARGKGSYDQLNDIVSSNHANQQQRVAATRDAVYQKNGAVGGSKGSTFSLEV